MLERLNQLHEMFENATRKIEAQEETILQLSELCPEVASKFRVERQQTIEAKERIRIAFNNELKNIKL